MKNAFGDEIEEEVATVNTFGDPVEAAPAESADPGFWKKFNAAGNTAIEYGMKPVAVAGEFLDRTTGAPIRAGISAAQDVAESDLDLPTWRQVPEGLAAFGKGALGQFGRDPSKAPTSKALFERAGLSGESKAAEESSDAYHPSYVPGFAMEAVRKGEGVSPAGLAGFALDVATPVPGAGQVASFAKGAGKGGAKVLGMAAEGGAKVIDAATGTKAASKVVGAAKTLGKSIDETTEGLKSMFKAKQADDFTESVKTAMANGIDPKLLPESVEFGPQSVVSRSARVKAEGPLGQPALEKFEQGHRAVQDAMVKDVQKIAGGRLLSPVEAGETMREGFNAGVERAFGDIAMSHNKVLEAAPDLRLAPERIQKLATTLQEMEAWAQRKIDLGSTKTAKTQGKQILDAVASIRKSGESYKGALDALREIGSTAFKSTNTMADIAPDIAKYRQLYGELSEAMIGTVDDTFDAATAQALRESNAAMSKIFGDKSLLGKLGEKSLSGEELFEALAKRGSTKEIQALKEYLTPEQLQGVKGAFLHDMVKLNPQGEFTFRQTFNRLRDNWDTAQALFEPGELDNYVALLRLGDKFGPAVMSTSGTGASNAFMDFFRTARDRGTDALITDPIKQKARAVGFDIGEAGSKAAAKRPGPGPVMSLAPRFIREDLPKFNPRARAARAYSIYDEEDEDQ